VIIEKILEERTALVFEVTYRSERLAWVESAPGIQSAIGACERGFAAKVGRRITVTFGFHLCVNG
jgi:hypothetical protein